MKIPAGALAQPQSETASFASGGTARGEHDGNFAQMFRKSLGKSQGISSSPAQSTAQETRPEGTAAAVQLRKADVAQAAAPGPSLPHASLSLSTPKTVTASQAAAVLAGFGSDSAPHAHASNPTDTGTPAGGLGSDSTPLLPTRAARAPVATTATTATRPSGGFPFAAAYQASSKARTTAAAQTAAQPTTAAIYRLAGNLAGSRALESADTDTGVTITTSATAGGRLIVVQKEASSPASPFGGFGTDNSPHLPSDAAGVPLTFAARGSSKVQCLAQISVDFAPAAVTTMGSNAAHRLAEIVVDATTTKATSNAAVAAAGSVAAHRLAEIVVDAKPATTTATDSESIAAHRLAQITVDAKPATSTARASATATSSAAATATNATADLAPLAAQATQPAELAASALPSLAPAAQADSAAAKQVPPAAGGATSRSTKPAQTVPPPAVPTTTVTAQPATDAKSPSAPVLQPWSEARDRISAVGPEERRRTQDSTDDTGPEPAPSLAIFAPAPNPSTPSSHSPSLHATQGIAVPERPHTPPIGEGKPATSHITLASPSPAPTTAQADQNGVRADAQMAAPLQQALPQVAPPIHVPATMGATSAAGMDVRAAAQLPVHAAPLTAQAARDDGLSMNVLPHAAHMAIESPDGDLALHLRIREGSAEISVAGSMAHLFDARAPEARAALAGEGLALGRFDSGQQGSGQQNQPAPEAPEAPAESPAAYRPHQTAPVPAAPGDGRIHVTA